MSDCIHHPTGCPVIVCGRVPYECEEKAVWYVTFSKGNRMARCNAHVGNSMSWAGTNTVVRIPREDHGE